jgi:GTPase
MTLRVAILGRSNVGKSTLFNKLTGKRTAIVHDAPGVTRDRRESKASIADLEFVIIDTAGIDSLANARPVVKSLEFRMAEQSLEAARQADAILFMIDARQGLTAADKEIANKIRKTGKPVVVLANKAEGKAAREGVAEAFALGLGEPIAFSAEHGDGVDELYDALQHLIQKDAPAETENEDLQSSESVSESEGEAPAKPLKLVIIGQPNAGKSTLVNAMLKVDRMLTGPEAGITRDAITTRWSWKGREIDLIDTAGMRRKAKVQDKVEKLAVADALYAIRFAECVVVLIDATTEIERQDLALADLVGREGRAVVLALNKWDVVESKQKKLAAVKSDLEDVLPDIRGVSLVTLSAKQGQGIADLMSAVLLADKKWNARVSTSKVNRWLEDILQRNPPPAPGGRRIKIRYATQVSARPPAFALFGNQLKKLPETYLRYLRTTLREAFDLKGVPIRFHLRGGKNPFEK